MLVVALVVLLGGVQGRHDGHVDMHDDGSGVVTVAPSLDPDAVQAAEAGGGKLEDRVRLADLAAAGWTVLAVGAQRADGTAAITLSKPFSSPDEVAGIIDEISGTVGPLKNVRAVRDRGAVSTVTTSPATSTSPRCRPASPPIPTSWPRSPASRST